MKASEAPEKIYLFENPISNEPDYRWLSKRSGDDDIEYTRTDAFIDKACEWLEEHLLDFWSQRITNTDYFIEDFKQSMEQKEKLVKYIMKQNVIISIRHPFAEKIYSGEKLYEFRKRRPNIAVGTRCWIYEPLPIGKVTGFFIYRGCYRDEKAKVWEHCQEVAGISSEAFMQYYDLDFYAHAWQVGTARRCPAFDLKDAGVEHAPQSYITWSSDFLENLIIMMNERKELNLI